MSGELMFYIIFKYENSYNWLKNSEMNIKKIFENNEKLFIKCLNILNNIKKIYINYKYLSYENILYL